MEFSPPVSVFGLPSAFPPFRLHKGAKPPFYMSALSGLLHSTSTSTSTSSFDIRYSLFNCLPALSFALAYSFAFASALAFF